MAPEDRTDRIHRRAYELWERAGRPAGREAEHWAEAEREIRAEEGEPATEEGRAMAKRARKRT